MIYLDYNATAPVRPEVRSVMMPLLFGTPDEGLFGNASSVHWAGQRARKHLEAARARIAERLARKPSEIIFTSGGTESDNLALFGVVPADGRLIVSAVEHPAVLAAAETLMRRGARVVKIGVDQDGALDLDALDAALREETHLISVMAVNNETGVCSPVDAVLERARAHGVPLHIDAVQAAGRIPLPVEADLLTLSGHKLGAPKGIGVLAFREGVRLEPALVGGPQERGRRAGTEPVAAAAGMAEALSLAMDRREAEAARLGALVAKIDAVLGALPGVRIAGATRVTNTTTAVFDGVDGEAVLQALDLEGIAASSGSACSSGSLEPSHVLRAMGYSEAQALSAVRFSLGWATADAEVDRLVAILPEVVRRVRSHSGLR